MPAKVKGMTSLEIAVIVAIVLAIAVAAAWYLYTTFASSIGSNPVLRVVSTVAFTNGTIRLEVMNLGNTFINIYGAQVFDTTYRVRGLYVGVSAGGGFAVVYIDTGRSVRRGTIIQGKLLTEDGHIIPFSARVI